MTAIAPAPISWPPERFYWSVLEAPGLRRPGPLPDGLLPEFQEDLPALVEDLHAVMAPVGDGRLLVCAAPREALAGLDQAIESLRPQRLPPALDLSVDCAQLDLCVGEFEPRRLRRARARRHALAAAATTLMAAVAILGFLRRAAHWDAVAEGAKAAMQRLVAEVAPGGTTESVRMELARLRPMNEAAAALRAPPDAARHLAALLKAWPAKVPSKPQSLSVTPTGATVSVAIEGDAAPFLGAFKPPVGWRAEEPRLNIAGDLTRVTLQLRPVPEAGGPR